MGQAQVKRRQAAQKAVNPTPAEAAVDPAGMTLGQMEERYQQLQVGLGQLRQQVLRQEGAVLLLGELIAERRGQEPPGEDA